MEKSNLSGRIPGQASSRNRRYSLDILT
jgi:hypothetical protein